MARKQRWMQLVVAFAVVLGMLALPGAALAAPPAEGSTETEVGVQAPPIWGSPTYVTAWSGLRLRESASLSAPIIFTLYRGETVYPSTTVIWNQGIAWQWVRVWRWGRWYEGFCASNYLASGGGGTPPAQSGLMVTATAGLRLRSGPGTWYSILRVVPYGTIVQPTGAEAWGSGYLWKQVTVGGATFWAASPWLTSV